LRASAPRAAVKPSASFQIRSSPIAAQFTPSLVSQSIRFYSAPAGLSKDEIEGRIVNLLKNFDKVRQNVIFVDLGCELVSHIANPRIFVESSMLTYLHSSGFRRQQGQFRWHDLPVGCPRHHYELKWGTSGSHTYTDTPMTTRSPVFPTSPTTSASTALTPLRS
jgi:hypothetical protein